VTGYTTSEDYDVAFSRGEHDGWLLKLDSAGNIMWSNTYGGSADDRIRCARETADGGFVFAGSSESTDLQCTGNHGNYDFWAGKVDSSGNLIWSHLYGGSDTDIAMQISNGPGGNYLVTGYTSSQDGDVTGYHGGIDGWVITIDSSGIMVSEKCLGGSLEDRLYRAYTTSHGKVILAGYSKSNDFDLNIPGTGYQAAYWLVCLDSTQNVEWSYATGGSWGDFCNELLVNEQDSTYTLIGDTRSNNMAVSGNHGGFDYWLVKLGWTTVSGLPVAVQNFSCLYLANENSVLVQSPVAGTFSVTLTDMAGRMVFREKLQLAAGPNTIDIPESVFSASGIFNLTLSGNGSNVTLKVPVAASYK
jgi:hypothetical protein